VTLYIVHLDDVIELDRRSNDDDSVVSEKCNVLIDFEVKQAALAILIAASTYNQIDRDMIAVKFDVRK